MTSVRDKVIQKYRRSGVKLLVRTAFGKMRSRLYDPKWPTYDDREVEALVSVLKSGNWGGFPYPGTYTAKFSDEFAAFHTAKHAICCNSGTTALVVALKAAGVGTGHEVLVPALTFAATATAVFEVGAAPVFVDIDPETFCIDPDQIAGKITSRTKCIMPVHLGSRMADMDRINEIAREHGVSVIEDAAHMHGGKWKGRGAGSLGTLGCLSFQTSKPMTAGEGGIILTDDDELAIRCHAYVNCGRIPDSLPAQSILGMNYRMTEFQAAILTVQLERLIEMLPVRSENYRLFDEHLQDVVGVMPLRSQPAMTTRAGHGCYFRYMPELCDDVPRERFIADLRSRGVDAAPGWKPVYQSDEFGWRDHTVNGRYSEIPCPVTERIANHQSIWIPHHKFLAERNEIDRMADVIRRIVDGYRS